MKKFIPAFIERETNQFIKFLDSNLTAKDIIGDKKYLAVDKPLMPLLRFIEFDDKDTNFIKQCKEYDPDDPFIVVVSLAYKNSNLLGSQIYIPLSQNRSKIKDLVVALEERLTQIFQDSSYPRSYVLSRIEYQMLPYNQVIYSPYNYTIMPDR